MPCKEEEDRRSMRVIYIAVAYVLPFSVTRDKRDSKMKAV